MLLVTTKVSVWLPSLAAPGLIAVAQPVTVFAPAVLEPGDVAAAGEARRVVHGGHVDDEALRGGRVHTAVAWSSRCR